MGYITPVNDVEELGKFFLKQKAYFRITFGSDLMCNILFSLYTQESL